MAEVSGEARCYDSAELSEAARAAIGVSDYRSGSSSGWPCRIPSIDSFGSAAAEGVSKDEIRHVLEEEGPATHGQAQEIRKEPGDEGDNPRNAGEGGIADAEAVAPQIVEF